MGWSEVKDATSRFVVAGMRTGKTETARKVAEGLEVLKAKGFYRGAPTPESSPDNPHLTADFGCRLERGRLAARAKRTSSAKLTRIAERSGVPAKREAARAELLARMAPPPLPDIRDEWDNLPDAVPDGIVSRR